MKLTNLGRLQKRVDVLAKKFQKRRHGPPGPALVIELVDAVNKNAPSGTTASDDDDGGAAKFAMVPPGGTAPEGVMTFEQWCNGRRKG